MKKFFLLTCYFYLLSCIYAETVLRELKSIDIVEITYTSEINHYSSHIKIKKDSVITETDLPKLKNGKYKLVGWKQNDNLIKFPFIVRENTEFYAVWEEKNITPSDWIQILVVIVALLAIFFPRWFQKRDERKVNENAIANQPKLRLHSDEKDEGIFTKCSLMNGNTAYSFKIRVFNDGFTTAKNVQLRIKGFDIRNPPKLGIFNYSFFKLFWSYQDQKIRMQLPLDTRMDIQPKSYEDCDFIIIDEKMLTAFFVSEQSNLLLNSKGTYGVTIIVSGDNIVSFERVIVFTFDNTNAQNPIEVKIDFTE